MSKPGFVYILANEYMPDLIKIGCTERSPRARAEELSNHTGVPTPFRVLCFAEFDEFQAIERHMHEWCKDHRVNSGREFFQGCLVFAVRLLFFHPDRHSFTDATAGIGYAGDSELCAMVCKEKHESYLDDLRNPFAPDGPVEDERIARAKRISAGDFSDFDHDEIPEMVPELEADPAPPLRVVGGTET